MKMNKPKKPVIYYYIVMIIVAIGFNALVMPLITKNYISNVDYSTFIKQVEVGNVKNVEISDEKIAYTVIENNNKEHIYITGKMDDPELVKRLVAADVKFSKVIPDKNSSILSNIFSWLVQFAVIIAIGQIFSKILEKKMKAGGGAGLGNAMSFGKSNAKIYVEAQTGKSFADVAGQEEAKEALAEIIDYLHNPSKYSKIGAKIPKGVLLVGPPGTGKTLVAKAVAGESKVPFFSISGSEFVEMFVGMGAAIVRDLFKQAQEKAPCIVFIDEIDAIGKSRNSGPMGGNDEREQTLNQLLSEMDGFSAEKGVIILAATNRPETLDKALLRPGRFDRRIPLELPDLKGREAILKVHAKNIICERNIDLAAIARSTPGASGADLANLINEAALRAVKLNRDVVNQSDLEESVEVVLAGYQKKNSVINENEKRTVAYHEIGHALVAAKQSGASSVHKITIIPRTSGALGYTMQVDEEEKFLYSKEQVLEKITTYMGGRAAEELILNTITTGASNDIAEATKLARAMVTRYGMSDKFGMMALETINNPYLGDESSLLVSNETSTEIDEEVRKIISDCYNKAMTILKDNKGKLAQLAKTLYEQETLTGEEFMMLLNQ